MQMFGPSRHDAVSVRMFGQTLPYKDIHPGIDGTGGVALD